VAGGKVPQFGEDKTTCVGRCVREYQGEEFELEARDVWGLGSAEEEVRGIFDKLVGVE